MSIHALDNNADKPSAAPTVAAGDRPGTRGFRYWSPWLLVFTAAWLACYFWLMPNPGATMARNWIFVPVGFCGAILGNISAIGGGIVFIPVMIFLFKLPPVTALKIAIASQSFGMTSGAIGWIQKRAVPFAALKLTVPGLLLGSAISSLVIHPNAMLVKLLFGPVSIILGVLTITLARRAKKIDGGGTQGRIEIPRQATIPLVLMSVVGGLLTGWIAIGEGELVAALLMLAYGVDVAACIGLGVVLLSINSFFLTGIHQFFLGGMPWHIAAFTGFGCVFGARLAPYLSRRSNPLVLKNFFAAIAIGDGILFILQFIFSRHPH